MTSRNKRIDDLQAASGRSAAARRELVEPQLTAFANWQLPHGEAVELLGESQLDAWRSRMVNLVRWACVRRAAGEQPGLGDPIQIATLIASSRSSASRASIRAQRSAPDSAFRASGRFIVNVATAPVRSICSGRLKTRSP